MKTVIYQGKKIQLHAETLEEASKEIDGSTNVCAGIINHHIYHLCHTIRDHDQIDFVKDDSEDGQIIRQRTLIFVFLCAVEQLYPQARVEICHSYAKGLYCTIEPCDFDVLQIKEKMKQLIVQKEPIQKKKWSVATAIAYFKEKGQEDKANMIAYKEKRTCNVYELCNSINYFYGVLLPNTSYLSEFSLCAYEGGVWLSFETNFVPQPKLFAVIKENEQWAKQMQVSCVSQLNHVIQTYGMNDLIAKCEAKIETKLVELTQQILTQPTPVKLIFISGPSSSGKTTFAKRLAIHLSIHGKQPFTLSMDDFYKNRVDTPKLEDGTYDFENIDTIDLPLFHKVIDQLLHLQPVHLPRYDFVSGEKVFAKEETRISEDTILIIEGIHGLNEIISKQYKEGYKIYINALTHLNLDEHNRISTSDYRMVRRIVRDYHFRGYAAQETLSLWPKVKEGENTYIYKYQEQADSVVNTSMVYEMPILKKVALPLLRNIKEDHPYYLEAKRISNILSFFVDGDETFVPSTSILAEFIGKSIFF